MDKVHKTVSTNHNSFEEKGEPKRYRTEVLPLTSLTPYREAKPADTHERFKRMLFIRMKHNMQIFRVIPFIKLQNDS